MCYTFFEDIVNGRVSSLFEPPCICTQRANLIHLFNVICWYGFHTILYGFPYTERFSSLKVNVLYKKLFNRHASVQHIDLKVHRKGSISEDLKSILISVRYITSQFFVNLPCRSSNLDYRSLESI